MNDQALLASLVRESTRDDAQKAALEQIADQFVLAELVVDDPIPQGVSDYRVGALNRISDSDVLLRVASSSSRYSDRAWRTILKSAEDAQSLTELALDEGIGDERRAGALPELGVRCERKVVSEDELRAALVTVATSSAPETVGLAAVDNLVVNNHGWKNDEVDAVLARLALTDSAVCERAAQGIIGTLESFRADARTRTSHLGSPCPRARTWTSSPSSTCSCTSAQRVSGFVVSRITGMLDGTTAHAASIPSSTTGPP